MLNPAKMAMMLYCLLHMGVAYSAPGIEVESSDGNFSTGLYEETVIDMQVKVLGGEVTVRRQWKNSRWIFNPAWVDLTFQYGAALPDAGELVPEQITRNDFVYKRQSSTSKVYVYDKRKTIVRNDAGYRWMDRQGDWIDYDTDGKMLAYGNRNNVRVSLGRDAQGRIATVSDHLDNIVLTFAYDASGRVASLTDYSGRSVVYTYSGNDLVRVRDVRGFEWQYAYVTLLGQRRMSAKTDPEGRITHINHVLTDGGQVCVQTDVGTWVYNEATNRWEQQGGRCLRWMIQPQSVLLVSISDVIGKLTENRYFYDANSETYSYTVTRNGRRITQQINLKGEILGEEINGEIQSETVISTDRRRRVVTDRHGLKTIHEHDEYENQTRVTYPDDSTESWIYDQFSNILTHTNENGVTAKNEYDAKGNLIRKTEAQGTPVQRITEYAYDAYGNRIEMKQLGDAVTQEALTRWTYDNYGNISTETDAEGHKTEYTHDVLGNVLTVKDPRGNIWTNTYDASGNLLSEATPLNHITRYEYDKAGNRVKTIDALNNATVFEYDVRDRMVKETNPYGHSKIYTYNPQNQLVTVTDEENKVTRFEYDAASRLVTVIDGNNNITRFEYGEGNAGLNQISRIHYPAYTREHFYDTRGRQVRVRQMLDEVNSLDARFVYDAAGNQIQVIDPAGRIQQFQYDALNRQVAVEKTDGGSVINSYDNRDNLLSVTNENNVVIRRYQYDRRNLQTHELWPEGQIHVSQYDANGNLTEKTDAKGQASRFSYDTANRLLKAEYFESQSAQQAQRTVDYDYNAASRLIAYNDGQTQGAYTYDNLQRKLSETVNYGAFSLGYSYSYTPGGKKASLTYPDGTIVEYGYDTGNLLNRIGIPGRGNIMVNARQWHAPTRRTLPGGITLENQYDAVMRFERIVGRDPADNTLLDYAYQYDLAGNIIAKTTEHGAYQYGYDLLDRLTDADHPVLSDERYSYDPVGNRLTSTETIDQWQYSDANQLTAHDEIQYSYDLNGNAITKTASEQIQTFVYDIEDRLVEVRGNDNALVARYAYDPFGRRLSKTVNGQTTHYHYSNEGLIAEYNATGAPQTFYGYKPDGVWSTDPVFMRVGGDYYYYINDHLGTPQKLIGDGGSIAWSAEQSAFGQVTVHPQSTVENNLRFPGQYYDQESDLYYNYFRYYDPKSGRYITSDPVGIWGGINTYSYVGGNPLSFFDSLGLYPDCVSNITGIEKIISNHTEETIISRDYGFVIIPREPTVTHNLDPRNPRKTPMKPSVRIDVWWALTELFATKLFETEKVFQNLKVFCTEERTDECGNTYTFRTNFERRELVRERTTMISESIDRRQKLIRLLFSL